MRRIAVSASFVVIAMLLAAVPATVAVAGGSSGVRTAVRTIQPRMTAGSASYSEGEADLSISKTDEGSDAGPDPVSAGKKVVYRIDVTNEGPYDAANVTVTDTPSAGKVVGASGDGWDCSHTQTTATCTLPYLPSDSGSTAAAGGSALVTTSLAAEPIYVTVEAPASGTITDIADVSSDEFDPNSENDTATETTTVTPKNTADHASGFYDGNPLKLSTAFGAGDLMKTTVLIPAPSGPNPYQPGPVVDNEVPPSEFPNFCGSAPCDAQIAVLDPIPSGSQPDAPIRLQLIYRGTAKPGNLVYGQGDNDSSSHLLPNCDSPSVARVNGAPAKCVASIVILNGDKKVVTVNIADGGDPAAAKR